MLYDCYKLTTIAITAIENLKESTTLFTSTSEWKLTVATVTNQYALLTATTITLITVTAWKYRKLVHS